MPATATSQVAGSPVAAMAAPTSAAIASHAIGGSRHAGDCNIAGRREPIHCHGSSHKCCRRQPCNLREPACRRLQHRRWPLVQSLPWQLPQVLPSPAMQSVGAGMPATATSQVVASPVAAMAAPTSAAMAAPTSAAIASHAICGSRHAGDCNIAGRRYSGQRVRFPRNNKREALARHHRFATQGSCSLAAAHCGDGNPRFSTTRTTHRDPGRQHDAGHRLAADLLEQVLDQ